MPTINVIGIILNFAAAICFAWPEKRIPPEKVTWSDVVGAGTMEKIKNRKKAINIAGLILLVFGLTCQITVAIKMPKPERKVTDAAYIGMDNGSLVSWQHSLFNTVSS